MNRLGRILFWSVSLLVGIGSASPAPAALPYIALQNMMPFKIAGVPVGVSAYDTADQATSPVCLCPIPVPPYQRYGLSVSFWEPARFIETVQEPYYFPFIKTRVGGTGWGKLGGAIRGGQDNADQSLFAQAHYFIFPYWTLFEILLDSACLEASMFTPAYLTEVDILWQDDEMTALIEPEAVLFANIIAQLACIADSVGTNIAAQSTSAVRAALFWCMGSSGSAYPLTGHIRSTKTIQGNFGIASRLIYKLGRQLLLCDTNVWICACVPTPIWIKPNYKMHASAPNPSPWAWPIGKSQFFMGPVNSPVVGSRGPGDEFLWMLFRKRACCMM